MLSFVCVLTITDYALAATITVRPSGLGSPPLVVIQGKLQPSDANLFRNKIGPLSQAVVAFQSDGGSLLAGIEIGETIRLKNFATLVPDNARCASACAIAWLGGTRRFMSVGAKIGFHAASVSGQETGTGNALVGAYLNKIGLSYSAVIYITQASPDSITWLSVEDAKQQGIEVTLLETQHEPATQASHYDAPLPQPKIPYVRPETPQAPRITALPDSPESVTVLPKTASQRTGGNPWAERIIPIKKGDTLSAILRDLGATPEEIKAIAAVLGYSARDGNLKESQKLRVLLSPVRGSERLQPVRLMLVGDQGIEAVVALSDMGRYVSVDVEAFDFSREIAEANGASWPTGKKADTLVPSDGFDESVAAGPFEDGAAAYRRGDYATAIRLWRRLAEQGDADAQLLLGSMYAEGKGVSKDYAQAASWYRKAAENENSLAQGLLGKMYHNGQGVSRSYEEAFRWLRKGAEQGDDTAQALLGLMYYKGEGVSKDYVQAYMWLNLAATRRGSGAAKARDGLEQLMTTEQIADAQKRTAAWQRTRSRK